MVYRDGTDAEAGRYEVSYIPHMFIVDGDGEILQIYDGSTLGALHQNGTLADTIHDEAVKFKE